MKRTVFLKFQRRKRNRRGQNSGTHFDNRGKLFCQRKIQRQYEKRVEESLHYFQGNFDGRVLHSEEEG